MARNSKLIVADNNFIHENLTNICAKSIILVIRQENQ